MQMDFLCLEAADRVQILEGMKMRPSSLTLFILAPERIALTSRLKGEGRSRERRRVKRRHRTVGAGRDQGLRGLFVRLG